SAYAVACENRVIPHLAAQVFRHVLPPVKQLWPAPRPLHQHRATHVTALRVGPDIHATQRHIPAGRGAMFWANRAVAPHTRAKIAHSHVLLRRLHHWVTPL